MVNAVSFQGTYRAYVTKADVERRSNPHAELESYCYRHNLPIEENYVDAMRPATKGNPYIMDPSPRYIPAIDDKAYAYYNIVTPDSYNERIEALMANKGIKFEKINEKQRLTPEGILKRIKAPKKGYTLAHVDAKKIDKLLETQKDSNFAHTRSDYNSYFKDHTMFALKSHDSLEAQTLSIRNNSDDGSVEALRDYVSRYGIDGLNPGMVAIWQGQRGFDSQLNTYHAMQDLGIKSIPVYMDNDSLANAQTLGLLA